MSSSFSSFIRRCFLLLVLVVVGVTNGIIGPSLIYLEKLTSSSEDEVTLVFTARAVGSIAGWLFGLLLLDSKFGCKPYNLICASTFGLFTVFILLPWMARLWWIMAGFTFHGLFITLILQGTLSSADIPRQNRHSWSHYFLFATLFGCALAPLTGLTFFENSSVINPLHSSVTTPNAFPLQQNKSLSPPLKTEKSATRNDDHSVHGFYRSRREAPLLVSSMPSTVKEIFNNSMGSNSTQLSPSQPLKPILKVNVTSASYNNSSHSTTASPNVTTNLANKVLSKPSITDAKHLNQDASAADGSKAAVIMKQLSEQRRIDEVNNIPVTLPPAVTSAPTPPNVSQKTVDTHDQNINITLKSGETEIPKVLLNRTVIPQSTKVNANRTDLTGNSSHSSTINTVETPSGIPADQSKPIVENNLSAKVNKTNQTSSKEGHDFELKKVVNDPEHTLNTSNKQQHVLSSGNVSLSEQNTTTLSPSSSYRKYVLEHWPTTTLSQSFSLTLPLLPVQKVYLCVSFVILFIWLLSVSLLGWFQFGYKWRPVENSQSCGNTAEALRLRRRGGVASTPSSEFKTPPLSPSPSEPLISHQHDVDEYEKMTNTASKTSQYNTRTPGNHIGENGYRTSAAAKVTTGEMTKFVASRPPWPAVHWPSDAWMLIVEFLNSGLETAFGAFVYGFTVRYLSWSLSASLTATTLFWFGDLIGRVPHWFLVDISSEAVLPAASVSRRRSPQFVGRLSALSMLHIIGGLLCVIVSAVLTGFSGSTAHCVAASANQDASTNQLTWLFGSFLLGVGLGLSSNGPPALSAANSLTTANRLFLASVLGQLMLPPIVGYVHHMAVFWHFSCALSSATLTISLLLTIAQSANIVYLIYFR